MQVATPTGGGWGGGWGDDGLMTTPTLTTPPGPQPRHALARLQSLQRPRPISPSPSPPSSLPHASTLLKIILIFFSLYLSYFLHPSIGLFVSFFFLFPYLFGRLFLIFIYLSFYFLFLPILKKKIVFISSFSPLYPFLRNFPHSYHLLVSPLRCRL